MIACVYIHCYITQNDCPWILPFFSSKKSPTKNKQNTTRLLTNIFDRRRQPSPGTIRRVCQVAAAEIQGFEANAEHYLVVKEGSGDNGRARIRQQGGGWWSSKKKKISTKKGRVTENTGIITKLWELCGCDFLFLPGFFLEVGEIWSFHLGILWFSIRNSDLSNREIWEIIISERREA